jgi:hypothetical protein
MGWKRKAGGGVLGFVGFMLSPLSWWNDLFVNVPLAVGAASVVAWFYPPAFQAAAVVAYWMTNVLGFVLMHKGARRMMTPAEKKIGRKRELLIDALVSLAYTALILVLIRLKVLQPVGDYFRRGL